MQEDVTTRRWNTYKLKLTLPLSRVRLKSMVYTIRYEEGFEEFVGYGRDRDEDRVQISWSHKDERVRECFCWIFSNLANEEWRMAENRPKI